MTSPPVTDRFQKPQGPCDLVMKGGITSGVVYPRAILELAEEYRFRSVGGGSVGAIAAALAAAAERNRRGGGFEKIGDVQENLLEQDDFLLDLFRPTEVAKPLMDTLVSLAKARDAARKKDGRVWVAVLSAFVPILLHHNPKAFLVGAVTGAALGIGAIYALAEALDSALGATSLYTAMIVIGAVSALVMGVIWTVVALLVLLLRKVISARNFYGMCTGHGEPPPDRPPPLTDWLSAVLDGISGIEEGPLLFRHLEERPGEDAGISLKVMTTNLNHNEPYLFPRKKDTFIFDEAEMKRFFPDYVVDYMVKVAEQTPSKVLLPEGLYFLPRGDDLPVIVPVRMAISFPILLCAVPLYTIDPEILSGYEKNPFLLDKKEEHLQINWFSDSGICSNFPIHFFDAWLPKHPTFGVNLTSLPPGRRRTAFSTRDVTEAVVGTVNDRSREKVRLPRPDDPDHPEWSGFRGLVGFARAIFYSAQNYRDSMQSRLPSYQERVVQIRLEEGEGGLNLAMDKDTIESMMARGVEAGELFKTFRFDHHQWVRLRVLMNQLERQLEDAEEALASIMKKKLLDSQREDGFPYPIQNATHVEAARRALEAMQDFTTLIKNEHVNSSEPLERQHVFPPVDDEEPEPTLRVTPNV